MSSPIPLFPLATLVVFAAVALAATSGCVVTVGGDVDEEDEDSGAYEEPEAELSCDVEECRSFCSRGGSCPAEAGEAEATCVSDCLDSCGDGVFDEADGAVMQCVFDNYSDPWCTDGLLGACCQQVGEISDFCE